MMPALTSSSLKLPMSASSFSEGITPFSEFFVALTMTMTRIVLLLSNPRIGVSGLDRLPLESATNETGPDRHVLRIFPHPCRKVIGRSRDSRPATGGLRMPHLPHELRP